MDKTEKKKIEKKIRKRVEKQVRELVKRPAQPNWIPYPPEYLAERTEFAEKWEALTAFGKERGFLQYTGGYIDAELEVETADGVEDGSVYVDSDKEWEEYLQREIDRGVAHEMDALADAIKNGF